MKQRIVFIIVCIPLFCWGMKDEDVFPQEHDPEEIITIKTNDQSVSDSPIKVPFKIARQMVTIKNLIDGLGTEITDVPVHSTLLKKLISLLEKYPEEKVDEEMDKLIAQIKIWDEDLTHQQKSFAEGSQEVKDPIEKQFEAMRAQAEYRLTIDKEETPLLFEKELKEESFAALIQLLNAANYLDIPKLVDLLLEHALLKKVTDKDLVELNKLNINLPSFLLLKMSQGIIKPRVIEALKTRPDLHDIALSCNGTYLSMSYASSLSGELGTEIFNLETKSKKNLENALKIKFDAHNDALLYEYLKEPTKVYRPDLNITVNTHSQVINTYDIKEGKTEKSLSVDNPVEAFAVSSDGQWIALSSHNLKIYDRKKQSLVHNVNKEHMMQSYQLFFTPDNKAIINNALDHDERGFVFLYNTATGKILRTFERYEKNHESYCALNAKKMHLATGARKWHRTMGWLWKPLKIWNLHSGVCIKTFDLKYESFAFSQDGELLALFGKDKFDGNILTILETSGWNILHSLPIEQSAMRIKVIFHPNNELIFIGFLGEINNSIKVVKLSKPKLTIAQIAYIMHHEQNNGVVQPQWIDHYNSLDETVKDAIAPLSHINIIKEGDSQEEVTIDSNPSVEAAKVRLLSSQPFATVRENMRNKLQLKKIKSKEQATVLPEQNKIPAQNKPSLWNRFLNWWRGKK